MSASQRKKCTKTQTSGGGGEGDEHWSAGVREEESQTYVSVGGRDGVLGAVHFLADLCP